MILKLWKNLWKSGKLKYKFSYNVKKIKFGVLRKFNYFLRMSDFSVYKIFFIFIIYSFVGWTCEVLYCSIFQRKFVNRGFLYGPICPIYGCGALIVFSFLMPLENRTILLFFASMILTTILEYITSWVMEKLFATKWWDYSNYRFNINGRVCLLNSVLFGIMGVVAVKYVNPVIMSFVNIFNDFWIKVIGITLMIIFLVDLIFTIKSLVNFKLYLKRFEEFIQALIKKVEQEKWVIDFQENVEEFVKKVKEKLLTHTHQSQHEKIKTELDKHLYKHLEKRDSYKRLMIKFPGSKSKRFSKPLEEIKSLLKK